MSGAVSSPIKMHAVEVQIVNTIKHTIEWKEIARYSRAKDAKDVVRRNRKSCLIRSREVEI